MSWSPRASGTSSPAPWATPCATSSSSSANRLCYCRAIYPKTASHFSDCALGQGEGQHTVAAGGTSQIGAAGGDQHHILLAVFAPVGDGRGVAGIIQLPGPDFLAGFCVEGAEAGIVGAGDEGQAAGGHDRAAIADPAGVLLAGRGGVGNAQRHMPGDVTSVDVH